MFQDCVSSTGIAVMCDRLNCLPLVMHSQLPSLLSLPVRSVCLVWGSLLLLWHLVHVPSAQQPWHEWSWLSLGSTQGLPHQTASYRASSLVHWFLWILSHSGEWQWCTTNFSVCLHSQVNVTALCCSTCGAVLATVYLGSYTLWSWAPHLFHSVGSSAGWKWVSVCFISCKACPGHQ